MLQAGRGWESVLSLEVDIDLRPRQDSQISSHRTRISHQLPKLIGVESDTTGGNRRRIHSIRRRQIQRSNAQPVITQTVTCLHAEISPYRFLRCLDQLRQFVRQNVAHVHHVVRAAMRQIISVTEFTNLGLVLTLVFHQIWQLAPAGAAACRARVDVEVVAIDGDTCARCAG